MQGQRIRERDRMSDREPRGRLRSRRSKEGRDLVDAGLANLIFLGVLIAIFYFMLIRPQKRRVDAHRRLVASIDEGDEIVTIGGLFGTVKRMGDEDVEIEISPGTTVRIVKSSVARRVTEDLSDQNAEESPGTEEERKA
jgi:preprotein translocase subunit YajC